MPNLVDIYCRTIHRHFRTLFGVWPIGSEIQVGHYGVLSKGYVFKPRGHLSELGIEFDIRSDPVQKSYEYRAGVSMEVKQDANVDAPAPSISSTATVELNFSKTAAIAFSATNAKFEHMRDPIKIGDRIREMYRAGDWDEQHVVVHQRLLAQTAVVFVSEEAGAVVRFQADSSLGTLELANFGGRIQIQKVDRIGLQAVAEEGSIPLIGLSGLQRRFWGLAGMGWGERSVVTVPVGEAAVAESNEEEDPENIMYSQLRWARR